MENMDKRMASSATGAAMVQMIMSGMDELTDRNLRKLVYFMLQLLEEQK